MSQPSTPQPVGRHRIPIERKEAGKWLIMSEMGEVRFPADESPLQPPIVRCTIGLPGRLSEIEMPQAATRLSPQSNLIVLAQAATVVAEALLADAEAKVRARVVLEGKPAARLLDREQRATH